MKLVPMVEEYLPLLTTWLQDSELCHQINVSPTEWDKPAIYRIIYFEGKPIGVIGLFNIVDDVGELGILIPDKCKGLLSLAYKAGLIFINQLFRCGFRKINAYCWESNLDAIRIARKAGFSIASVDEGIVSLILRRG